MPKCICGKKENCDLQDTGDFKCLQRLDEDWQNECLKWYGEVLTGKYAHWCNEWDGLPLDETCIDIAMCNCFEGEEFEKVKEPWNKIIEERNKEQDDLNEFL